MSKVELYAAIRRDARVGLSGRAIQRKHGVGWRTVAKGLSSAWPEPRKKYAILRADLGAPRTQRHTVKRIAAIVDRLTLGGTIIEVGTNSYRLAQTRTRAEHHAT